MSVPTPLRQERTPEDRDWSALTTPVLTIAIQALEERVLLWLVTIGAGVIWGFTVKSPDLLRIGAASLYSLTVFLPMLWRSR